MTTGNNEEKKICPITRQECLENCAWRNPQKIDECIVIRFVRSFEINKN